MPWFFTIPEFIKKRACRYLLQHYLGQFLEEKISLNDLTVDLYNGTGTISNVPLNVEAVNEALQSAGAPLKVLSGYIGHVTVSVPWSALLKENCKVEISELALSVAPHTPPHQTDEQVSMTDSLFFNMTSSRQLAEEVMKGGPSDNEEEAEEGGAPATVQGFEGMEALAKAIELVLARVQVTLSDTVIQVNYRTADQTQEYFLKLRVQSIEFYDELSKVESSVDLGGGEGEGEREGDEPPLTADFSVKALKLSGLTVELGNEHVQDTKLNETLMEEDCTSLSSSCLLDPELHGIPVAKASGQVTVRVKLKQNEAVAGPKLEVDGFLGSLHLLFSPQQLSMLLEMTSGILNEVQQPPGFEKLKPGQSRPILKGDLKTIESQLARHQLNEQKAKAKKLQREDPFHANPWDNSLAARHDSSTLVDSTISTNEEFYSLDLAHSFSGSISTHMTQSMTQMEDSFISTMSRVSSQDTYGGGYSASSTVAGRSEHSTTASGGGGHIYGRSIASDLESIPLHEGVGLQQLSLSPPFQTPHYHHSSPNHYHHASSSGGGVRGARATGNSGGAMSFTPVGYNGSSPPMPRGSCTRIGTDGGGSLLSSAPSKSGTQASTAAHRKQHHYAGESRDQDVCRYSFAISGITLALLEADPMHTHCTPATQYYSSSPPATAFQKSSSQSSSPRNSSGGLSSVDEGGLDPMKYFETVSALLEGGINRKVLQNRQEELSQVLPNDHLLLWLSTVKCSIDVQGPQLSVDVSMVSAELWEYLYRNQAMINHITKPVSVSPIIQLVEDSYPSPRPCLKLKLTSTTSSTDKKRSHGSCGEVHTTAEVLLTTAQVSADVTLLDRLQPLLATPTRSRLVTLRSNSLEKMKHSLYMTSSNIHTIGLQRQAVFNQAVSADPSSRREHRLSLRTKCNTVNFSLRFPVPNLTNQKQPPWYQSSLRNEVLFATVSDVGLSSQLSPPALAGEATYSIDAYFNNAKAYLSCDGSVEGRQLFLSINNPSTSSPSHQHQHQHHPSPIPTSSLHHVPTCGSNTDSNTGDTAATISIVVQPVSDSVLAQVTKAKASSSSAATTTTGALAFDYTRHDSLEAEIELRKSEPLPFSSKRSMFSTGKVAQGDSDDADEMHSRELVLPGSPSEMSEFEQHAINLAQYSVLCTLPSVNIHIPSKKFLQTLYHRFASDLLLWQPASPSSVEKANAKSMLFSCMDVLQPAATQEDRFQMCKSVLKEEDAEDEGADRLGNMSPPYNDGAGEKVQNGGLSRLAFSLTLEKAKLTMLTEVKEPPSPASSDPLDSNIFHSASSEGHLLDLSPKSTTAPPTAAVGMDSGLVYSDLSNIHLFSVSGYKGDPTLDYFCAQVQDFSLHHIGSLELAELPAFSCVEDSESSEGSHGRSGRAVLDKMLPIVYRTRGGPAPHHKARASQHLEQPLFTIAMEMKLDKERNSTTNKCALGLQNATIGYHMTPAEHNCFKQLAEFFDFGEEEVDGYESPSLITELHTHLTSCAVEYRPLYLPLHVLLSFDSMSLSTNLVTGAPVLVLKLVVDGTYLSLANQQQHQQRGAGSGGGRGGGGNGGGSGRASPGSLLHVCVLEMEWFELTLRLCDNSQLGGDYQKLFSRLPDVSVECSSNVVHLRTCADSCIALRDLMLYLSRNGDLQRRVATAGGSEGEGGGGGETQLLRDYSTLGIEANLPPSGIDDGAPLSSENGNIGHLIDDAMEDIVAPTQATPTTTSGHAYSSASGHSRSKRTPPNKVKSSPSKSKMEIHMSGEKSVVMEFNSDSDDDDDDDDNILRDLMSHHRPRQNLTNGSRGGGSGGGGRRRKDVLSPTRKSMKQSGSSDHGSIFSESDEDFCVIDAPTITRVAPGARPQVKCLLEKGEKIELIENHFTIPDRHTDQLQRPKHYPEPILAYTLKEMTVIWHMYGGRDFQSSTPPSTSPSSSPSPSPSSPHSSHRHHSNATTGTGHSNTHYYSSAQDQSHSGRTTYPYRPNTGSSNGRTTKSADFMSGASSSSRGSYTLSSSPRAGRDYGGGGNGGNGKRRSGSGGGGGKRAAPSDWRVAGGPGRDHSVLIELELDKLRIQHETYPKNTEQSSQLTLLVNDLEIRDRLAGSQINKFLYQYTTEAMPRQSHANMISLKVLFTRPELETQPDIEEASVRLSILPIRLNMDQDAILFISNFLRQLGDTATLALPLPSLDDAGVDPQTRERSSSGSSTGSQSPVLRRSNKEVFVRSFVFQPELPIRIDYEAKGFKTEMGTLAGILLGLSHLSNSEVKLKALTYKKGLLGWDKVMEYASNEWVQDIRSYQLPHILKGVGPMHHVTQLVYGVLDLVRLPYYQYQEDGRILWGLQRGATAFTSSTGVAMVELTSRMLETVQSFAQMAYDLVSPSERSSGQLVHQHKPHEPLDVREGFANAYDVVYAGIGSTATDMYTVVTKEHEEKGVTGAVGGVLRQLPGTIVKPIILASEATRHMLGGVKNQFVPDARKEASEKWKSASTND